MPSARVDESLPIAARVNEIRDAIAGSPVVVVSGETGSGKSTQLPLVCLQLGYGAGGFIGHTQPRRIAARSVAARVSEQLSTPLGRGVGYKIRFHDQTAPETFVKIMTDGILLAETQSDRFLEQYEVLIIDEAHERSLNIDFLLGYIKRVLPKRPDLRVVITSATIDTDRFARHFSIDGQTPVPVIEVEGRTFPVDILYRPPGIDSAGQPVDQDDDEAVVDAITELAGRDRGDMLVFLPTEHDIRTLSKRLRGRILSGDGQQRTEILPLYSRLTTEQQNLIFQPHKHRRIVLATNVAESSITVPGIRYVVDTGTARISRYAPRSKVQRLPIEAISQASAEQRAGRCGRVGPGVCVRVYAEEDLLSRPKFTTPEIRRSNLASVILQTESLELGSIAEFPFIDPPSSEGIRDGYKTLFEIGAVDQGHRLTSIGRQLSLLPVDPRIGRIMLAAKKHGCLAEILVIASALELQDPRIRPAEQQGAADQQHAKFKHEESDFVAFLTLWDFVHDLRKRLSRSQFRKACQQNFLSMALIQQWMEIHRQLKSIAAENRWPIRSDRENYQSIHQALLTGFLSGVAMHSDRREYLGAGGIKFDLWPGSGLARQAIQWVLVSEIVETGRRYGRTVAKIDPAWIEPVAEHLVKRTYSEPHWSKKRQSAMAYEKLTLFGLPVVTRRPIRYAPIDPGVSRALLIEEGLVGDQMRSDFHFLKHNRTLREEISELAAKSRKSQWIVDDYSLQQFYDRRLPESVVDGASLAEWLKEDSHAEATICAAMGDLVDAPKEATSEHDFPREMAVGSLKVPLEYNFTPGQPNDGVTLRLPLEGLSQIHENQLGWMVPGLLCERVAGLIRTLPKQIRRNLVPAPDTARRVAESIDFGKGAFWQVVAEQLSQIAGQPITPAMFEPAKLADHLRMNIQVFDQNEEIVAQARSITELRKQLVRGAEADTEPVNLVSTGQACCPENETWNQDHLVDWTWNELPEQVLVVRGGIEVPLFPAIVDGGESVSLRLFDNPSEATRSTRAGLTTLFHLAQRKQLRGQVNWLPDLDRIAVLAAPLFTSETPGPEGASSAQRMKLQISRLICRLAFVEAEPIARTRREFDSRKTNAAERLGIATQEVAPWLPQLFERYHACRVEFEDLGDPFDHARRDVASQMAHLFPDSFLTIVPWSRLQHYPRYLQAIVMRLERLRSGGLARDQQLSEEIVEFWNRFATAAPCFGTVKDELERFSWMLQEYRVSVFAQSLGTGETISSKRLEKQWQKVAADLGTA